MTSNIRVLDTRASAKAEVVERAEQLLRMAQAGELVDLSYAAAKVDGSIATGFTPTEDAHRRLSAVSMLLFRLHRTMEEQAEG